MCIRTPDFGVMSKAKSKHVDPITDDNELLDAISCGGLKLETTPERAEEPKTVDMLGAINEEEEEEGGEGDDKDGDECNNDSRFYYHLDLSVFCIKKNKNIVTGIGTRKSNTIEYIRIKLLNIILKIKPTRILVQSIFPSRISVKTLGIVISAT